MWVQRLGLVVVVSLVACDEGVYETGGHGLDRSASAFYPADGPGPYNVGVMTVSQALTGGRVTQVQFFYPTAEDPDPDGAYTVRTPTGSGFFQVPSPLGAVTGAAVAPGEWPTIVYDHGGGLAGADYQRIYQAPLHEHLASQGFVVVTAPHSANANTRVDDLRLLIDRLSEWTADPANPFYERIDLDRIGTSGFSAGGTSAFNLAAGNSGLGMAADPRIRAAVFYEPGQGGISYANAATMTVPYLIFGGTQFVSGVLAPDLFAATTASHPRILVQTPGALHVSNSTGMCGLIEAARDEALLEPGIPEPLTYLVTANPAANLAYSQWNLDQGNYLIGVGFGGGRNVCDGLTYAAPLVVQPPYTLAPAPPESEMAPAIILYTVAFWQAYLADDPRYLHYFAPGYANGHDLPSIVQRER